MSAGACPVCGSLTHFKLPSGDPVFNCGGGAVYGCGNARAAEIERLKSQSAELIAELKAMLEFVEDYANLTEGGQAKMEPEYDERTYRARALISHHNFADTKTNKEE